MPVRICVLSSASYPRRIRNTDLRQGTELARHLARFSRRPAVVEPLPAWAGLPGVVGPIAIQRAYYALQSRQTALAALEPAIDALVGRALVPSQLTKGYDALLGHGLLPWPPVGPRGPAMVWGAGFLPELSTVPALAGNASRQQQLLALVRRRASESDAVFVTLRGHEDGWREKARGPRLVRRVPYLVPHLPVSGAPMPEGAPPSSTLEVLFVGGEARRKNLPRVVDACRQLVEGGRSLRLTVVSAFVDGPVDIDAPWVRSLGARPLAEVQALMRASHVLCVPSVWESFGLVYVEAMAAGVPVVAPDLPIQRANLGEAALLAAPDDVEAIARAVEAVADPAERERRREAGWALYRRDFAPDVVATAFVELCEEAAAQKRAR
jgi:glycosyltransferase involved in cell wall biosynthesis